MHKLTVLSPDKKQQVAFNVAATEDPAVFRLLNDKGEPEARGFTSNINGVVNFRFSNLLVVKEAAVYGASLLPSEDLWLMGSLVNVTHA